MSRTVALLPKLFITFHTTPKRSYQYTRMFPSTRYLDPDVDSLIPKHPPTYTLAISCVQQHTPLNHPRETGSSV